MSIIRTTALAICFSLFGCVTGWSQSKLTEHTLQLDDGQQVPAAKLEALNWLVGYRHGTAFGGKCEVCWLPTFGPSMTGTFKLVVDEKVRFYEILTIVEENDSLTLKLKHFDSELKGWEEKDEFLTFRLVKITEEAVYFDGLTYQKQADGTLDAYVAMRQSDGSIREGEVKFGRLISTLQN